MKDILERPLRVVRGELGELGEMLGEEGAGNAHVVIGVLGLGF